MWLRAMLLCPCTLGCRRSVGFLRQACVLRRVARNQDASNGWRVPRRFQVTFHKYDYQGRHASQVQLASSKATSSHASQVRLSRPSRFTSTTIKAVTLHKYDHQVHVLYFQLCFLTRPDTQVRRSSTASQASVFIYAFTQGPHQDRKHVYGKRFLPVLHLGHSQATYSALISWSKGMCI